MGMHKSGRNDNVTPGASLDKATPIRYLREYIEQVQAGLLPSNPISVPKEEENPSDQTKDSE